MDKKVMDKVNTDTSLRLSIIVPVYNVEKWVLRCLNSLYNQSIPEEEFEVIVVNDGSPDNSLHIVNCFAENHFNVVVVSRENGGLSAARNTGLEYARGNYVWFVDSDDFIEPNSIKYILEFAEKNKLDTMGFLFQRYFESGKIWKYEHHPKYTEIVFNGEDFVSKTNFIFSPWASIYRRIFLIDNSLRFKEGILHEDVEFSPRAHFLSDRIAHTNKIVYNYFQRDGSIMKSSKSSIRVKSFLNICDSLYDFMQSQVSSESPAIEYFRKMIMFAFSQALSHYVIDGKENNLKQFKTKPYYPLRIPKSTNIKLKIKGLLINNMLRLYISILYLNKKYKNQLQNGY